MSFTKILHFLSEISGCSTDIVLSTWPRVSKAKMRLSSSFTHYSKTYCLSNAFWLYQQICIFSEIQLFISDLFQIVFPEKLKLSHACIYKIKNIWIWPVEFAQNYQSLTFMYNCNLQDCLSTDPMSEIIGRARGRAIGRGRGRRFLIQRSWS